VEATPPDEQNVIANSDHFLLFFFSSFRSEEKENVCI
jgi:hypothetical protein